MEIVSIINQKGGVGKSTTSENLGHGLSEKGYKVLFIDLDPQCNLTSTFNLSEIDIDGKTTIDVLEKKTHINDAIIKTDNGDIIVSSPLLANLDSRITDPVGKDKRMLKVMEPLRENPVYDYVIIDTPPSLSLLTINALTASDSIIIPAQADGFSIQGIDQLFETVNAIWEYNNNNLKVKGILLTRYNGRTVISRQAASFIEQKSLEAGTFLYNTKIRECTALKEAQLSQQSIFKYDKKCNGAIDYMNFVEEFLAKG